MEKNKKFEIINEGRLNAVKGGNYQQYLDATNPNCPPHTKVDICNPPDKIPVTDMPHACSRLS